MYMYVCEREAVSAEGREGGRQRKERVKDKEKYIREGERVRCKKYSTYLVLVAVTRLEKTFSKPVELAETWNHPHTLENVR